MVKIGFIVEGHTEKILIESTSFQNWAKQQGIEICKPVLNAKGGGNLLPQNIEPMMKVLQLKQPNYIVILTDLEREPTQEAVKARIGTQHTGLIFIAIKAIEAWFLADSSALSAWLKTELSEIYPEKTIGMPWDRLGELAKELKQRGTGASKVEFAKKFMEKNGFDFARAANHLNCPSAKEFHDGLINLAK